MYDFLSDEWTQCTVTSHMPSLPPSPVLSCFQPRWHCPLSGLMPHRGSIWRWTGKMLSTSRPCSGRCQRRSLIVGTLDDPCVIMRLLGISASPAYFPFNLWHNKDSIIAIGEDIYTQYRLKKRCVQHSRSKFVRLTLDSSHPLCSPLHHKKTPKENKHKICFRLSWQTD